MKLIPEVAEGHLSGNAALIDSGRPFDCYTELDLQAAALLALAYGDLHLIWR